MATKTLGLTGRDYSTFAAYAAYVNALSFAADEICEVYNDGGPVADTTTVTLNGYTRNGFNLIVRAASGQGFGDNANKLTNALKYNAANGAALTNNINGANAYAFIGAGILIEGLQFTTTNSGASLTAQMGNGTRANRCIFDANQSGSYVVSQNTGGMRLDDCLITQRGSAAGGIRIIEPSFVLNGCTIACPASSSGRGVGQTYASNPVVKNTVVYGFANDYQNTAAAGTTNNATSLASFGGTGWGTSGQVSVSSSDFESVTAGSEDWRVKSTSPKLKALGAGGVTTVDIVGTTRSVSTPTIGAWEAGAGGTPVSFSGTVSNQSQVQNVAGFNLALAGFFSGTLTPFTYNVQTGTLPTGLTLNTSTGAITGTPTVVQTQTGISVRATDTGTNVATTNTFQIQITAPAAGSLFRTMPGGALSGLGSGGKFFQNPL